MKKLIFCLCLLIGQAAFAGNTGWTQADVLHPWPNGLHITVKNNVNDPDSCGGGNGGFMLLPLSAPNYELISSVILASWAANKDLRLYTHCDGKNYSVVLGAQAK